MRSIRLSFTCLLFVSGIASAQGVQNSDIFWLLGPRHVKAQAVPGSTVTVRADTGITVNYGYGYQLLHWSAAGLWLDISPFLSNSTTNEGAIPGHVDFGMWTSLVGARVMVPLHSRLSLYGITGGGGGSFRHARITGGASPSLASDSNAHGVFELGAGLDVRLTRLISLRGDFRDLITGRGLSGATGRNHLLPSVGVALHF